MAFRSMVCGLFSNSSIYSYYTSDKSMSLHSCVYSYLSCLRGYTTSTSPKTKAYNATANFTEQKSSKKHWGAFVPVYVAVGFITVQLALGLHSTAKHQLFHNPHVFVKKRRREMLPEVVEPDRVVEDAEKFVNKSFFRKVAHIQEFDFPVTSDPILGYVYAHRPRAVTLKDAGVDPKEVAEGLDPRNRARLGEEPKKVVKEDVKAAAS